jgi:hypothetical protein
MATRTLASRASSRAARTLEETRIYVSRQVYLGMRRNKDIGHADMLADQAHAAAQFLVECIWPLETRETRGILDPWHRDMIAECYKRALGPAGQHAPAASLATELFIKAIETVETAAAHASRRSSDRSRSPSPRRVPTRSRSPAPKGPDAAATQAAAGAEREVAEFRKLVPICFITLDFIRDPVLSPEGIACSRRAIVRHYQTKQALGQTATWPATRSPLDITRMTPGLVVSNLTEQLAAEAARRAAKETVPEARAMWDGLLEDFDTWAREDRADREPFRPAPTEYSRQSPGHDGEQQNFESVTSSARPASSASSDRPESIVLGYHVTLGDIGADRCIGTVVGYHDGLVTIEPLVPGMPQTLADHLFVRPVLAQKKDKTVILEGDSAGQTGMVLGFDREEAIVKMDENLDIRILKREWCARLPEARTA